MPIVKWFSNPYAKGQYEYHGSRKKQQLKAAIVCALVMAAFIAAGLLIYHTKKNLLMIPGLLMVLPMANFFVTWLALADGHELPTDKREAVAVFEEAGMAEYHLMYVNEKGRRQFLEVTLFYQGAIVAYASKVKEGTKTEYESDCIMRLRKKGVTQRLRIYTDWNEYLERIREIAPEVPADEVGKVEKAKDLFLSLCL